MASLEHLGRRMHAQAGTHFWDTTVGGSWRGSPASTQHWAPRVRGTSVAGSVACHAGRQVGRDQ